MINVLRKLESVLQSAFERSAAWTGAELEPLDLVRQIEREIERNKRVFINDQTFVAHKLVVHLYAPTQSRVEEYEALFNNREFGKYVEDFIAEHGYRLLDRLRVVVQCHQDPLPQFGKRHCFVEFSWPQMGQDPGEVTVLLDPANESRILSVNAPQSEMAQEAWLEVLEGDAAQSRARIARREFNIGRTENVVDSRSNRVLRINHLAFLRPGPDDLVNRSVSRQHARIVFRNNAFQLYDTGGQNGTAVEQAGSTTFAPKSGRPEEGIELQDGAVLVLGRARVRFHLGPMPASTSKA